MQDIARILDLSVSEIERKLRRKKQYTVIKQKVLLNQAEQLRALKNPAIQLEQKIQRG